MIVGRDDEQTVRLTMEATGLDETTVRFMLALERGEIDGDMEPVDADGNLVRTPLGVDEGDGGAG